MLGIIRFFLATSVIIFHLVAKFPNLGLYAVNCFYVISGYLMTMILNRAYDFKLIPFAQNRFLRLFPSYWFACIMGILCISLVNNPSYFHHSYDMHISVKEFLGNLLLVPWAFFSDKIVISPLYTFATPKLLNFNGYMFRAVTSSWSVAVEIICYLILWLFVARGYKRAISAILASSIYHWYSIGVSDNIITTYSPFLAAMLPFSIGALGYFLSHAIENKNKNKNLIKPTRYQIFSLFLFSFLFITNWYIGWQRNEAFALFHYYFNNIIAFGTVLALHGTKLSGKISRLAKFLGNLSYPIFLYHFFMGLAAWQLIGQPTGKNGWLIFFIGYGLSILFGTITIAFIDKPISINQRFNKTPKIAYGDLLVAIINYCKFRIIIKYFISFIVVYARLTKRVLVVPDGIIPVALIVIAGDNNIFNSVAIFGYQCIRSGVFLHEYSSTIIRPLPPFPEA